MQKAGAVIYEWRREYTNRATLAVSGRRPEQSGSRPLSPECTSGCAAASGGGGQQGMSNTGRPIKHALKRLVARELRLHSLLRRRVISVPGETEKVISKQSNNRNPHYYSLELACRWGGGGVSAGLRLPSANEEPASGNCGENRRRRSDVY